MAFWEVFGTAVTEDNNAVTFRTFVPAEELVDTVNEALDAIYEIENPDEDQVETCTNGCFASVQGISAVEPPLPPVTINIVDSSDVNVYIEPQE
jgi:hypothetical protein